MTIAGYFNTNLGCQNHAEPKLRKKSLQNADFEAIYLFSVNNYHTSAVVKSVPLQFQRNLNKESDGRP